MKTLKPIRIAQQKVRALQNLIKDRTQRMREDLIRRFKHEPIQMSIFDALEMDEEEEE